VEETPNSKLYSSIYSILGSVCKSMFVVCIASWNKK